MREALLARGIRVLDAGPRLTPRAARIAARMAIRIARRTAAVAMRGGRAPWHTARALGRLAVSYGMWHDFFRTHRIKIHVAAQNPDLTDVAIGLAMDALGGASLAYQYSASPLFSANKFLSAGEHVQFVFSPRFAELWRRVGAPLEAALPSGFIYDQAFTALREDRRVSDARGRLEAHGASFVLCYFDENTVQRWDDCTSHEGTSQDYEFLLRWVLDDPEFGLICKPKKSVNLFERIARVAPLLEEARRTGRCLFLTDRETLVGRVFPAEAAMMSDLCVGRLGGTTTALEAQLAGVPALLIDRDGFHSHPLRQVLPQGRVIFDDWTSLRAAVDAHRATPDGTQGLGNWSRVLPLLDPYRDGRAAERLAAFVEWLMEGLREGLSRGEAIARAAGRYHDAWPLTAAVPAEAMQ
jgi:hypothetical protein